MSAITAATAVLIPLFHAAGTLAALAPAAGTLAALALHPAILLPSTLPPGTLTPAILSLPWFDRLPLNLATLGAHDPNPLLACLGNGVLAWGLAACGLAQLSKLAIELVLHRRWRPAVLIETGGMPSSHAALISGTAAGVGWQLGYADPLFALAAVVAFIVLYDASGVRHHAGLIAKRVNGLPTEIWPSQPNARQLEPSQAKSLPALPPNSEPVAISKPAQTAEQTQTPEQTQTAEQAQTAEPASPAIKPLKESLGHTRLEVLVGSLIGPAIVLPGLALLGSPLELAHRWGLLPIG
jgi:acid phosphatase family membrane protein YuiD